jgi:hypothetical protein
MHPYPCTKYVQMRDWNLTLVVDMYVCMYVKRHGFALAAWST